MADYPAWLLELVNRIAVFEADHPTLYEKGEVVAYDKNTPGEGVFHCDGYLIGDKVCLEPILGGIPDDVVTAAYWYTKGKEAARGE